MLIVVPAIVTAVCLAATPVFAGAIATGAADRVARSAGQRPAAPSPALPTRYAQGLAAPGLAAPRVAQRAARPAGRLIDDAFNGDSCTTMPDNPSIKSTCLAVGTFLDASFVEGLLEFSTNGQWFGNSFGSLQTVTAPLEVSCVPQQFDIATCVAVGEHFTNPKFPIQLVATGSDNGLSPVTSRNPTGTTWSVLDDVSCASTTFCLLVGAAGTTRRTTHGLRYLSHATAFKWNGGLHPLKVPSPAHAKGSELAGVSCASATNCLAVGNYTSATGRSLPYSALWSNGSWHLHPARTIRGKAVTLFQAVSCAAPADCIAVGEATRPGQTAFAEHFASGKWTVQRIVAKPASAFFSVSCPTVSACVAAGQHGSSSLIEAWNGTKWAARTVPRTPAPFTRDVLFHVSCVSASICTAVGYRHNPATRFSNRTLALGFNGSGWKIQKTINQ